MKTNGTLSKADLMKKLLELDSDIKEINGLDFISQDHRTGLIEIDMEGSTEKERNALMDTIRPIVLKVKERRLEQLKTERTLLEGQLCEKLM
jgi:hypothetical protein